MIDDEKLRKSLKHLVIMGAFIADTSALYQMTTGEPWE